MQHLSLIPPEGCSSASDNVRRRVLEQFAQSFKGTLSVDADNAKCALMTGNLATVLARDLVDMFLPQLFRGCNQESLECRKMRVELLRPRGHVRRIGPSAFSAPK